MGSEESTFLPCRLISSQGINHPGNQDPNGATQLLLAQCYELLSVTSSICCCFHHWNCSRIKIRGRELLPFMAKIIGNWLPRIWNFCKCSNTCLRRIRCCWSHGFICVKLNLSVLYLKSVFLQLACLFSLVFIAFKSDQLFRPINYWGVTLLGIRDWSSYILPPNWVTFSSLVMTFAFCLICCSSTIFLLLSICIFMILLLTFLYPHILNMCHIRI